MGSWEAGGAILHAADWAETEIDGLVGAGPEAIRPGSAWAWHGALWRLDAADGTGRGPLRLTGAIGRADLHRMAAGRMARLMRRRRAFSVVPGDGGMPDWGDPLLAEGFRVTDGRRAWSLCCLATEGGRPRAVVFEEAVPPPGVALWVVDVRRGGARSARERGPATGGLATGGLATGGSGAAAGAAGGPPAHPGGRYCVPAHPAPAHPAPAACVAPELAVETQSGPVPAAWLRPGDTVLTDAGPAPLRAVRLVPGAAALRLPAELAGPGQPPGVVTVGRDTWIGVESAALSALFAQGEALVRAGDLDALPGVRAPVAPLIALTLDRHAHGAPLIMAGGLPCLAGPVEAASLRALSRGEAQIALGHAALKAAARLVLRSAA